MSNKNYIFPNNFKWNYIMKEYFKYIIFSIHFISSHCYFSYNKGILSVPSYIVKMKLNLNNLEL